MIIQSKDYLPPKSNSIYIYKGINNDTFTFKRYIEYIGCRGELNRSEIGETYMGNSYLDVLERIANALEQQNRIPVWEILINIIPWIGVIIPIIVLFIERGETKRPYVEVSFELVRSTLACLVIRNVGRVPVELKSMTFNDCFIQQLSPEKTEILKNKNKLLLFFIRIILV